MIMLTYRHTVGYLLHRVGPACKTTIRPPRTTPPDTTSAMPCRAKCVSCPAPPENTGTVNVFLEKLGGTPGAAASAILDVEES